MNTFQRAVSSQGGAVVGGGRPSLRSRRYCGEKLSHNGGLIGSGDENEAEKSWGSWVFGEDDGREREGRERERGEKERGERKKNIKLIF